MTGYGMDEERARYQKSNEIESRRYVPPPKYCPKCGKGMKYDPGDGCVHGSEWYCDAPGCHYNDRGMATMMAIVEMKMRMDRKSISEIIQKLDEMRNS